MHPVAYVIREGDPTTTGGKVIKGSATTYVEYREAARISDPVWCPKCSSIGFIAEGNPTFIVEGIAVATHGHAVQCGCLLGSNRLLATQRTMMAAEDDRVTIASEFAALAQAATHAWAKAISNGSYKSEYTCDIPTQGLTGLISPETTLLEKTQPVVCNHPDQMEELASYIAGEMNRNIHDPAVLEMKKLINYDPDLAAKQFAKLPMLARLGGPPNFSSIAKAHKVAAAAIWTRKVGQNQEWDHKPKLKALFNGTFWHKQGKYMYFYDIWSNIHYGYIGIIGGLSESVLLDGAGAEQIASDALRKGEEWVKKPAKDWTLPGPHPTASPWTELRSWDDVADRVSISIGVRLANLHPNGGITAKMIMDEVLTIAPENWGEGIDNHKCE